MSDIITYSDSAHGLVLERVGRIVQMRYIEPNNLTKAYGETLVTIADPRFIPSNAKQFTYAYYATAGLTGLVSINASGQITVNHAINNDKPRFMGCYIV